MPPVVSTHRHGVAPVHDAGHERHRLQQLLLSSSVKGHAAHGAHGSRRGGSSQRLLLLLCSRCDRCRVCGALHLTHGLCVLQNRTRDGLGGLLKGGEWVASCRLQQLLLRILRLCRLIAPLQFFVRKVGQLRELGNVNTSRLLSACCGRCRRRRAAVAWLLLWAACLAAAEDGA